MRVIANGNADAACTGHAYRRRNATVRLWPWFAAMMIAGQEAGAQNYPASPLRIVVGFAAGSGADVTARLLSQELSEHFGQAVVVDNRPGGAGAAAAELVARSPKDGYTMLLVTASDTILPALRNNLPYDLERDLAPVSLVATGMYVLVVHPSLPARTVKELIALARLKPGRLSYGTSGIGSSSHLAGALFSFMAQVNIVPVPYKSATAGANATAAGEIEMNFPSVPGALPLLAAGRVIALAVTGAKRTMQLPSVPTLNEAGLPGYDRTTWHGISVPAGTPQGVIARLNAAVAAAVGTARMIELFLKQGIEAQKSTPDELAAYIHGEIAQSASLVRRSGAKDE